MISVKNLHKYYNRGKRNELHVLNDINLEFADTGLVCILGESGSGKTTLLNTIGGLGGFYKGSLDYEGKVVKRYQPEVIEKIRNDKFGYIFQNYYLLQDYTVEYNVKLALNTFTISEEEKEERVSYVLEQLKILKYRKKLVSELSGGQMQRVSIARALVKSPKIILADEPTGNLDEENTLRTMSILKKISEDCLVILVTHERRIAKFFADRIIEIKDGQVEKDYENHSDGSYERMDDGNIYLKDMQKRELEGEDVSLQIFEEGQSRKKIRLNFAWKNGKLYIQNLEQYDILLEGEDVGCEMIDAHKPVVEMEEIDAFDFRLEKLKAKKSANLSAGEIWKLAIENLRLMGKKQAFIIVILLLTGVLLTVTLANFTNSFFYDEKYVLKEDSHIIRVSVDPMYQMEKEEFAEEAEKFYQENFTSGPYANVFKSNGGALLLNYDGFTQLSSYDVEFKDFSYASLSQVQKKDLIYGRMPENMNEIVVDKWLFERFLDGESPFKKLFQSVDDFLGQKLKASGAENSFEIVGICDKDNPTVYMDENRAVSLTTSSKQIASDRQLKEFEAEEFQELSVKEGEVWVSETDFKKSITYHEPEISTKSGLKFKIAGSIPDDIMERYGMDYVLCEADCEKYIEDYMVSSGGFDIYMKSDVNGAVKKLRQIAGNYRKLDVLVMNPSAADIKKYEESKKTQVSAGYLVAVAAAFVALFIIYFMIRSNVASRTEELTVYRLIGIQKGSIMKAYMLEMFLVTSYTILPVCLITSGVIRFIGSIPSLELALIFPWWAAALLIIVLYAANLLISVLPVWNILSEQPAVLAARR